jgi:hypothetical protein
MPGIDYILNSTKPYPAWLKEHRIFKNIEKIEKVFPTIGLANFTADLKVPLTDETVNHAHTIIRCVNQDAKNRIFSVKTLLTEELLLSGKERNGRCNAMQNTINILSIFTSIVCCVPNVVDGKIEMAICQDIFSGNSTNPIFKKGEGYLKCVSKLNELLASIKPILKINYEAYPCFKDFSRLNVPNKPLKMYFSSTGEEGAWDIATASMRGIISCQTWTAMQARGLIGSITSKYTGVVFVEGNTDYSPYGKIMTHRCFVRLLVHRYTRKPVLFFDSMYPAFHKGVEDAMKEEIAKKTSIPTLWATSYSQKMEAMENYTLLHEDINKYLRQGEYSYMDSIIPVEIKKLSLIAAKDSPVVANVKATLSSKMTSIFTEKHTIYLNKLDMIKKFIASGKKNEEDKPKIDYLFCEEKGGKQAIQNILNFYHHFTKNYSTTRYPAAFFANAVLEAVGNPPAGGITSQKDVYLWLLKRLNTDFAEIKAAALKEISSGSWMRAFPKASIRFLDATMLELKKEIIKNCK